MLGKTLVPLKRLRIGGNAMNCPVCNRPLKSQKSISRGIGPVCERKLEKLNDTADQDQIKMELSENGTNDIQAIS